ncbi:MAG: phosphatidate cytidylyltransferase [Rhodobacteraceae bacterium]|jgi:phosphatidate cytidylyltransferase|nr:phosphatidate cytidylyltransferase [Paracoccaceae bacterium]
MTPPPPGKWTDLQTRLLSSAGLVVTGVALMLAGGAWFAGLAALAAGLMVWELARMTALPGTAPAVPLGLAAGAAVIAAWAAPLAVGAVIVMVAAGLLTLAVPARRPLFAGFALAILVAAWSLVEFRALFGTVWLFWLVFVVVVTDIMGYFGGKAIGGAKFWPAVSPKKTWAGIVAGWAGAGAVGALFLTFTRAGGDLVWISMLTAFASQMGDIAESALKRHVGVKDSSSLIPGHGGLMDRFDGLIGAALFMMLTALIVDVPQVKF